MMGVTEELSRLGAEAVAIIPQKTRVKRLKLYSLGVESKLQQADYALERLTALAPLSDHSKTTTADEYDIDTRVGFYCDSFWAFLYSSLDVLGHVINQSLKLGISENAVNIKEVAQQLESKNKGEHIQRMVDACIKSTAFKNLSKYRNCSTHRRDIYTEGITTIVTSTKGYSATATGDVESTVRHICDDPLVLTPRIDQRRKIPDYLEKTRNQIVTRIEVILKNLKPIR